jgi:hypothetical protein
MTGQTEMGVGTLLSRPLRFLGFCSCFKAVFFNDEAEYHELYTVIPLSELEYNHGGRNRIEIKLILPQCSRYTLAAKLNDRQCMRGSETSDETK